MSNIMANIKKESKDVAANTAEVVKEVAKTVAVEVLEYYSERLRQIILANGTKFHPVERVYRPTTPEQVAMCEYYVSQGLMHKGNQAPAVEESA